MPTRRLRRRLLDGIQRNMKVIGEVSLAGIVTAVVYACGGTQLGPIPDGGPDADTDATPCERDPSMCATEAAMIEGGVVEAAEAGCFDDICVSEAAEGGIGEGGFTEGGVNEGGFTEAGEAGFFDGPVTEAAHDAGSPDAH
jgi:hypothetical protein